MAPAKQKNVYQKMAAVMHDVQFIEKKGWNDFHKYKYALEADVVDAIRKSCQTHGLVIIPNVDAEQWEVREFMGSKNDTNFLMHARYEFTIIDIESGESVTTSAWGSGSDKGDKSAYKAFTGAQKYMLMKTFQIPTGDDPEQFNVEGGTKQTPQDLKGKPRHQVHSELKEKTSKKDEKIVCENDGCGQVITASPAKNGKNGMTASEKADFSRSKVGRVLCYDCYQDVAA